MAAAIIPIVTAVLPGIFELVAKFTDRTLGSGNGKQKAKTGATVAEQLIEALGNIVGNAAGLPESGSVAQLLQAAVDKLNEAGVLKGAATVLDTASPGHLILTFANGDVKTYVLAEAK